MLIQHFFYEAHKKYKFPFESGDIKEGIENIKEQFIPNQPLRFETITRLFPNAQQLLINGNNFDWTLDRLIKFMEKYDLVGVSLQEIQIQFKPQYPTHDEKYHFTDEQEATKRLKKAKSHKNITKLRKLGWIFETSCHLRRVGFEPLPELPFLLVFVKRDNEVLYKTYSRNILNRRPLRKVYSKTNTNSATGSGTASSFTMDGYGGYSGYSGFMTPRNSNLSPMPSVNEASNRWSGLITPVANTSQRNIVYPSLKNNTSQKCNKSKKNNKLQRYNKLQKNNKSQKNIIYGHKIKMIIHDAPASSKRHQSNLNDNDEKYQRITNTSQRHIINQSISRSYNIKLPSSSNLLPPTTYISDHDEEDELKEIEIPRTPSSDPTMSGKRSYEGNNPLILGYNPKNCVLSRDVFNKLEYKKQLISMLIWRLQNPKLSKPNDKTKKQFIITCRKVQVLVIDPMPSDLQQLFIVIPKNTKKPTISFENICKLFPNVTDIFLRNTQLNLRMGYRIKDFLNNNVNTKIERIFFSKKMPIRKNEMSRFQEILSEISNKNQSEKLWRLQESEQMVIKNVASI